MNLTNAYTDTEKEYLIINYKTKTAKEMEKELLGRTKGSIQEQIRELRKKGKIDYKRNTVKMSKALTLDQCVKMARFLSLLLSANKQANGIKNLNNFMESYRDNIGVGGIENVG